MSSNRSHVSCPSSSLLHTEEWNTRMISLSRFSSTSRSHHCRMKTFCDTKPVVFSLRSLPALGGVTLTSHTSIWHVKIDILSSLNFPQRRSSSARTGDDHATASLSLPVNVEFALREMYQRIDVCLYPFHRACLGPRFCAVFEVGENFLLVGREGGRTEGRQCPRPLRRALPAETSGF